MISVHCDMIFFLALLKLIFCKKFYIKLPENKGSLSSSDNKSVGVNIKNKKGDVYELESSKVNGKYFIVVTNKNDLIFDIEGDKTNLTYYKERHGRKNQLFTISIIPNRRIMIMNQDKCLEYMDNKNMVQRTKCNDKNENQHFLLKYIGSNKPFSKKKDVNKILNPNNYNTRRGSLNPSKLPALDEFLSLKDAVAASPEAQRVYAKNRFLLSL